MKQNKDTPKRKKDDEQKRTPGSGQTGSGPERMPDRDQEAHRVPNANPTTGYDRNRDEEEDENTEQRRRA